MRGPSWHVPKLGSARPCRLAGREAHGDSGIEHTRSIAKSVPVEALTATVAWSSSLESADLLLDAGAVDDMIAGVRRHQRDPRRPHHDGVAPRGVGQPNLTSTQLGAPALPGAR